MRCDCFGSSKLKRKEEEKAHDFGEIERELLQNIRHLSYDELRVATDNFSHDNKIGRGGFGSVYKGVLKNGVEVAVKTLAAESKQGIITAFDRALLGYTSDRSILDWGKCSAICVGIARGLAFLHEDLVPHIVHRDIKASNILLDKDFLPKIGDFGLAKLFPDDITHITTRIAGTTGYLAPEYALGGRLTKMADVYSFGVLVLEIISGRSSARADWGGSGKLLLEWAWQLYEEGRLAELIDPELLAEYPEEQVMRYMKVAFFCTQATANRRPLMSQVMDMLTTNTRLNEKQLTAPGFFPHSAPPFSTTHHFTSLPLTLTDIIAPR